MHSGQLGELGILSAKGFPQLIAEPHDRAATVHFFSGVFPFSNADAQKGGHAEPTPFAHLSLLRLLTVSATGLQTKQYTFLFK